MSYNYDPSSNDEDDDFTEDERENIEGHYCKASNTKSPIRGGHQLRLIKEAMPNTSLMACREPLANESTLAAVEAFGPQDEQERMVFPLMDVAYQHAMDCFARASKHGLDPERRDAELKHAMKLMDKVTAASEALDKHRGKHNQKIIVKRVYDNRAIYGPFPADAGASEARHPEAAPAALCDESAASADGEKLAEQLNVRQRQRRPVER